MNSLEQTNTPPPLPQVGTQKLLTIYLDNMAYRGEKFMVGSFAEHHGRVEEHLSSYLREGWKVLSINGFGGHGDSLVTSGWLAVLLEKV